MIWQGGDSGRGNGRGRGRGRGTGRERNDRGGREQASNNRPANRVCFGFQNGSCTRKNCRYSHDVSDGTSNDSQRKVRAEETEEQQQARTQYNGWKKYLGQAYAPSDTYTMRRVWEGALNVLHEDDRDWKQQLPRDLDSDEHRCNGRAHVKALVMKRATASGMVDYVEVAKNFLEVITHPSLVDCLAVDEYVNGIYNFIAGGDNGARAIGFFQHLCEALVTVRTDEHISVSQTVAESALTCLAVALYELLYRNQRARLNNDLDQLVNAVDSAAEIIPASQPSVTSTVVKKRVADIQGMIDRARGLVTDDNSTEEEERRVFAASLYPRDLVIPTDRHDNDKRDIADITVFPTRNELMSDAKEFLPSTDPDQPHFLTNKVKRHIDTNFRLYRHDVFGELKKALSGLLHAATDDPTILFDPKFHLQGMRAYYYPNAQVKYVSFDTRRGLQAHISFPQPHGARRRSPGERRAWWEDSRRMEEGTLLSYIFIRDSVVQHLFFTVTQKSTNPAQEYGLAYRDFVATITTKLTTQSHDTLETMIGASCSNVQGVLLEFPNILPATFVPILANLQEMQRLSRLRFSQWLLPDRHDGPLHLKVFQDIPPPVYARQPGFKFPLATILKAEAQTADNAFGIEATASCSDAPLIENIATRTALDDGQCRALVAALTREFAFIQGPPGTGKSYIGLQVMRILLEIKNRASLGPIIVVCYTNHALDQFLEHLIKVGITKVIRVGGQSKSELLEGHNLRDITRSEGKTKMEAYQSAMMYKSLEEHKEDVNKILGRLHASSKNADWKGLNDHISGKYREIHHQFRQIDDNGFKVAGRHPFDAWRPARPAISTQVQITASELARIIRKASLSVHSLNPVERCALVEHWLAEVRVDAVAELSRNVDDADKCHTILNKVHDEADRRVLAGADVIGVTTSGLAKRISVLKHVSSKVIVCEEAGEVMEPHMLSALLPTVEHCIQIGDHEQLRPTINNFQDLSLESKQGALHALDKSQFERLAVGERSRPLMPVAQLEIQRRMRPDVSTLIRETIYPKLIDHSSTITLPNVVGMRMNVYWLDHGHLEDEKDSVVYHSKSRSNEWEIDMVHALVRHIIRQGTYSSSEIAVLTPYTGQLQKLRAALRSDYEILLSDRDQEALEKDGFSATDTVPQPSVATQDHRRKPLQKKQLSELLRVATVDNFQGEEAKIIIVSLVRSNKERNVGFLKTSNRINVLLSRAQHGMYLIGNTETYSSVDMWQKVINMLGAKNSIGQTLALCCPRHVDKVIEIREPEDFATASPEGGCKEACSDRLNCGHSCQAACHSEAMHAVWQCEMPCQRRHSPCEHPCQKSTCGEDCGLCMVPIDNVQLPCGHTKDRVPCYQTLNRDSITCDVLVQKEVPGCKHTVEVKCSLDVNHEKFNCSWPCTEILSCGHQCPGNCVRCKQKNAEGQSTTNHPECIKTCGRKHGTCNHNCKRTCHGGSDCGLCQQSCEQCGMRAEEQPDLVMMLPYKDVDLDDSPIVVLGCKRRHFFTVETLDGIIGMKDVYEIDAKTGEYTTLKETEQLAASIPQCPTCREPVRQYATQRYNRVVNRAVIDEMSKRFIVSGQQELQELSKRLQSVQESLESTRSRLLPGTDTRWTDEATKGVARKISSRYVKASDLEKDARLFLRKMDERNKPSHKLHEAIVHAASKQIDPSNYLSDSMTQMSLGSTSANKKQDRDQRITLGGRLYHLKVRQLMLSDKFELLRSYKSRSGAIDLEFPGGSPITRSGFFLHDCLGLIKDCRNANSPKLAVETTLHYAHTAFLLGSFGAIKEADRPKVAQYRESAKTLLEEADKLCENAFQNRDLLKQSIERTLQMLGREFYEEVTKEEIEAIKRAMVGGRGGIATHTGHWYNCINGHPFAIGECGMPMQLARCPECGEPVGGQSHRAVAGVTRATDMEG
ncbi:P-loop containing nucleoside triphosphate hydrolase protein [Macroventuria anomochaeta]|uniref:P-loop containing nucleoside triphosphate hydrolase protein n=1 Tax=Macroventuria anomochaeta TaxID=301207 RepID=A0ACB6SCV2_9PLEO|nr:P-loop containing nucleoside triphosphate hydrolase protein [Macroventuria anomochaeta]KAF2632130.1 P-loop containing nucleoside triphosphate hydrolase protein [Macroventuria anomochaeta]